MNNLINSLNNLIGKKISLEKLDEIFGKYYWEQMGFSLDYSKLTYIEAPMGREIDLYITFNGYDDIVINKIEKLYWE